MHKLFLVFFLSFFLIPTVFSYSVEEGAEEFENYITQYKDDDITTPQLIVYLEYVQSRMYSILDKEDREGFTESEIETIFGSIEDDTARKEYLTDDFKIIFEANLFYGTNLYEDRGMSGEDYYTIHFYLEPLEKKTSSSGVEEDIESFINDLEEASETNNPDFDSLKESYTNIMIESQKLGYDSCEDIASSIMTESEHQKDWDEGTMYDEVIKIVNETECHEREECEHVCEEVDDCWEKCHPECETVCDDGEDGKNCWEECHEVCEEFCETREECHPNCTMIEECYDNTVSELRFSIECNPEYTGLWIDAWGEELEIFNQINEVDMGKKDCEIRLNSFVSLRKALQDSVDNDFAQWYFEDFLGDSPEKLMRGGHGFERVMNTLIWIEESIAKNMGCMGEDAEWPEGFEEINIDYEKNNIKIQVWERQIPVEWMQGKKMWTTLYTHKFMPSKNMMKEMILYQISETDKIGPSTEEINELKSDQGKMELIKRIADKYGGSLNIMLELNDGEEELLKKYVRINVNDTIKFSDNEPEEMDISISVDYDALYEFMSYMQSMESERIRGPNWIEGKEGGREEDGFGKFLGALGAVLRFWRTGVNISPPQAILKLILNIFDVVNFIQEINALGQTNSLTAPSSGE